MAKCGCSLRGRLIGDGCEVCNPAKALEYAKQTIADLERIVHAADILAHDIPPGDNRDALDRWWAARGGFDACTVCHPPSEGGNQP